VVARGLGAERGWGAASAGEHSGGELAADSKHSGGGRELAADLEHRGGAEGGGPAIIGGEVPSGRGTDAQARRAYGLGGPHERFPNNAQYVRRGAEAQGGHGPGDEGSADDAQGRRGEAEGGGP